jgi:flavin reductase (DIM6/NTAB) family NADH-FMN oxidoreductase RutF
MEISTANFTRDAGREFMTSVLVPRPVAWISTVAREGRRRPNLAPFSSVAPVCNKPPLLSFACGRKLDGSRKDTARNILETREFVVNFVGSELLHNVAVSVNGLDLADEFARAGVSPEQSKEVNPPRVFESLCSCECRLEQSIEVGAADCRVDLIIGRVVHICVRNLGWNSQSETSPQPFRGLGALGVDWYLVGGEATFQPELGTETNNDND